MQLEEIQINKLFGHFSHKVRFNNEEKITIITAPNGYGKTIILKIIHSIFNKKFNVIKNLDFDDIIISLTGKSIYINKGKKSNIHIKLYNGEYSGNKKAIEHYTYNDEFENSRVSISKLNLVDELYPNLTRIDRYEWLDTTINQVVTLRDILEQYDDIRDYIDIDSVLDIERIPTQLNSILVNINVHFVKDQRLINRTQLRFNNRVHSRQTITPTLDTIESYSKELSKKISECNSIYSDISKRLDGSLPTRLLTKKENIKLLDIKSLTSELVALRQKNERLSEHKLLDNESTYIPNAQDISEEDIKILSLYIKDNNEKLGVYDDLLSRIELFTTILNNKGLSFKKVQIIPDIGFGFVDDSGKQLKLTQLSSGEQHQVVLVFELIFIAKDNDIVLIDEPEISLHIAWQKEFLEDIKRIIDIQNVSVVIATHSPQIIDNNWDLTVNLEEE